MPFALAAGVIGAGVSAGTSSASASAAQKAQQQAAMMRMQMAEQAKNVAEHGTNVAFKGLPVGTLGRKFLNKRAASKELKETLSPIGGVKLKDLGK